MSTPRSFAILEAEADYPYSGSEFDGEATAGKSNAK